MEMSVIDNVKLYRFSLNTLNLKGFSYLLHCVLSCM